MTRGWWLALIGGAVVIGAGLVLIYPHIFLQTKNVLVTMPLPLAYPGFQVWPTPRTFDQPGTAFVRDGDQFVYAGKVPVEPEDFGPEMLFAANTTDNWNGSMLAQYMGTTPAKLKVKSDQKITVKVELRGAERWRIDPQETELSLNSFKWPTESGGRFVVMEAIAVRGIDYDVSIDGNQGGAVETPDLTDAKGSLSLKESKADGWSAHQSFPVPYYIFFVTKEVKPKSQGPGEDYKLWTLEPVDGPLTWTHEERPEGAPAP